MQVAILYSGGKDSNMALRYALKKGWKVKALIAVKPKDSEAYLWHYPTVEWTLLQSSALNIPLFLVKSSKNGPAEEARELEKVLSRLQIGALIFGGVGLQKTQINEVRKVADKFGVKVIVPYENFSSEELLHATVKSGFDIMITEVAADGLDESWLGKKLTVQNLKEFLQLSKKFGFDPLGEGGQYNTFILDAPFFKRKISIDDFEKVWDKKTNSGYIVVKLASLQPK